MSNRDMGGMVINWNIHQGDRSQRERERRRGGENCLHYHSGSTPVYVCYIDATKEFDNVNHWHLLRKLLDRNVPKCFVRLLMAWLTTQTFTVRWGGVKLPVLK